MSDKISGKVTKIRYQLEESGFTIGEIIIDLKPVTFKGNILCTVGDLIELEGDWFRDPKFGMQFKLTSGTVRMDESPSALATMLAKDKAFKGLGPVKARKLVDAAISLSSDGTMATGLTEYPESVADKSGVSLEIVQAAAAIWSSNRAHYDEIALLVDQGWSNAQAATLLSNLGKGAAAQVRSAPYALIGKIARFGFRTVDAIALKIGIDTVNPERLESGIVFCLDEVSNSGSTWSKRPTLIDAAYKELRPDTLHEEDMMEEALGRLIDHGLVLIEEDEDGNELVADASVAAAEFWVFDYLLDGMNDEQSVPLDMDGPTTQHAFEMLNDDQAKAMTGFSRRRVSVISGAGGVGKTFTMKAIVYLAEENGMKVGLCAPTGKAARKLSQATGREAQTIHRILGPTYDALTGGFRFQLTEHDPMDYDLVIVDEVSMTDVRLMRALLRAIKPGARLLLVGDHNQIPSVGPGAILRDILANQGNYPEAVNVLTKIMRQAGELAQNTRRLLDGSVSQQCKGSQVWRVMTHAKGDEQAGIQTVVDEIEKIMLYGKPFGPFTNALSLDGDIQVLAPTKKGPLGTCAINVALQALRQRLLGNPPPKDTKPNMQPKALLGDRVIWTKNDYELGMLNGTQATIVGFPSGGLHLFTDDGREVMAPASKRNMIEVCYAITIHKAQGSEWPFVVMVASNSHWHMHDQNLFYTAASRAAKSLLIVGDWAGMKSFATMHRSKNRQTFGSMLLNGWRPNAA